MVPVMCSLGETIQFSCSWMSGHCWAVPMVMQCFLLAFTNKSLYCSISGCFSSEQPFSIDTCKSFACASTRSLVVGNGPASSPISARTIISLLIFPSNQYAAISSLTIANSCVLFVAFCGSLYTAAAALWYVPGLWTSSKSNSINQILHQTNLQVESFKCNSHCKA